MGIEYEDFISDKPELKKYITQNKCNYGKHTPIPNKFLKTLSDNEVIMNFNVFSKLFELANKTQKTNCEHTFILFATNMRGNKCVINEMFESNTKLDPMHYSLDKNSINYINQKGKEVRNEKYPPKTTAVFIGHTHPAREKWYDNFSLGDLSAYSNGVWGNPVYVNREIESTAGCMLTADGKIRMCFFDPDQKDFYVFDNIKVKFKKDIYDFEYFFKEIIKTKNIRAKQGSWDER